MQRYQISAKAPQAFAGIQQIFQIRGRADCISFPSIQHIFSSAHFAAIREAVNDPDNQRLYGSSMQAGAMTRLGQNLQAERKLPVVGRIRGCDDP